MSYRQRGLAPGDPNDAKVLRAKHRMYENTTTRSGHMPMTYEEWLEGYMDYEESRALDGEDFHDDDLCHIYYDGGRSR